MQEYLARGEMLRRMPTHVGDVLILRTKQSFCIYAVGRVGKDGQQDIDGRAEVTHTPDYGGAVAAAKARAGAHGTIYLRDIDTSEWSEVES